MVSIRFSPNISRITLDRFFIHMPCNSQICIIYHASQVHNKILISNELPLRNGVSTDVNSNSLMSRLAFPVCTTDVAANGVAFASKTTIVKYLFINWWLLASDFGMAKLLAVATLNLVP